MVIIAMQILIDAPSWSSYKVSVTMTLTILSGILCEVFYMRYSLCRRIQSYQIASIGVNDTCLYIGLKINTESVSSCIHRFLFISIGRACVVYLHEQGCW